MNDDLCEYFSGERLYGDDFDLRAIEKWFKDEETAYYDLAHEIPEYEYHAFNEYYAYSKIRGRRFKTCLAFGCANGDDVRPLSNIVEQYVALEPAEKWWSDSLGGKVAKYLRPTVNGDIPLPDASVDLVVCFGVLHHIPNVSHVVAEISRVMEPGGIFLLREPIFSMGDWRVKRKGLTSRERGIPPKIMENIVAKSSLEILSSKYCMVPTTSRIAHFFNIQFPYNSKIMVEIDRLSSLLLAWNTRYHRQNLLQKLAPTSLFIVSRKFI